MIHINYMFFIVYKFFLKKSNKRNNSIIKMMHFLIHLRVDLLKKQVILAINNMKLHMTLEPTLLYDTAG